MRHNDLVGVSLLTGVKNFHYGVWRSRCCGNEIVLYRGAIFPMCNRHKGRLTEWVLISTDLLDKPNVDEIVFRQNWFHLNAKQHLPPDRLKQLGTGDATSNTMECAHLTACRICRSTLERLTWAYRARSFNDRPESA